jgi:hypothetical protein
MIALQATEGVGGIVTALAAIDPNASNEENSLQLKRIASGLSGAPRIAQGGKPSQGVTAIDPVVQQEAFDEGEHLVLRDRKKRL